MTFPRLTVRRAVASIESGTSVNAMDIPSASDETGVLKTSCVSSGYFDPMENKVVDPIELHRVSCPVRSNRLIISRMNTPSLVGAAGHTQRDYHNLFLPDRLWQVRTSQAALARYVYWWMQTREYRDQVAAICVGTSNSMQNLSQDDFRSFQMPFPDYETQKSVADFIDRETVQIDELIAKQEHLLELLAEKRKAVITEYVAEAVQPVSENPGLRLKYAWNVIDERANGVDFPLMSVSIHRGLQRRDETTDDEPRADDLSNYKVCRRGDVVINRMRAFQGALGCAGESGLISPDYLVLRPVGKIDPTWLSRILRSHWAVGQMQSRLRGIGSVDQGVIRTPRINASDLGEIRIRVPSLASQNRFLEAVCSVEDRLELLARKSATAVMLLRERRSALISAAVNGTSGVM